MRTTTRGIAALAAVAGVLALGGCADMGPRGPEVLPVTATVSNYTGRPIARIDYQPCGAGEGSWQPLPIGTLPAGASAQFQLPAACVNLTAFYGDGKVAGQQTGVKRDFPFTWTIS